MHNELIIKSYDLRNAYSKKSYHVNQMDKRRWMSFGFHSITP